MTTNSGLATIENNLKKDICNELDRIGIHYRLHSRVKQMDSLEEKISSRGEGYYTENGKKVQDVIGLRIVTYFIDDVNLLWDWFKGKYEVVEDQYDKAGTNTFEPLRKNMICRLKDADIRTFEEIRKVESLYKIIDTTFEIQFRTTLSEGWHEVDHALRYKCKSDWNEYDNESRMLNGVFASLETNDRALKALFDDMSYNHYKRMNWEGMLRMKFRLQFVKKELSLSSLLTENKRLAKKVFRFDRIDLISEVAKSGLHLPVSFDNIVYLIIYLENFDETLTSNIPDLIKEEFEVCGIVPRPSEKYHKMT